MTARRRKQGYCKECRCLKSLNRKGYCEKCAMERAWACIKQMNAKEGPFYDRWRASMQDYLDRTEA